jgi:hypothetical protein
VEHVESLLQGGRVEVVPWDFMVDAMDWEAV